MKSLNTDAARQEIVQRARRLTPDATPLWGKMNVAQMVCHITESMRMATGELPVAPKNVPVRYPPLKQLLLYVIPFPKGLPTAPELLARAPSEWNGDVSAFVATLDRFGKMDPRGAWPAHPAFGRMSRRDWGVLTYRHCDHHLRQFGA